MNPFYWGLSQLTEVVSGVRNHFYDHRWLKTVHVGVPVISIGNLTVGGTGKTPVADFCLRLLLEKGHRPGLVCRSYRASLKSSQRVIPSAPGEVFRVGDEALWFAKRFPQVPVWSGPVKTETALALKAAESVDVILVDDGFQHRRLHRDLDLLLLDAGDALKAYEALPLGRAREAFVGAARADAYLFTKVNLAEKISPVRDFLPLGKPVFEFDSQLGQTAKVKKAFLVSAIARPESFLGLVRQSEPGTQVDVLSFRDHHPYSAGDVRTILAKAKAFGADEVWTTEKDEVKLRSLWPTNALPLRALSLEAKLRNSVESFYEVLSRPLS